MLRPSRLHNAVLAALVFLALLFQTCAVSRAGTTGLITGHVATKAGVPLANVAVTASSGSGTFKAKTDGAGFFSMTGVVPDTYVVSYELPGYDRLAVGGISVYADETAVADAKLYKSLRTIAQVTSRNTNGAYQPHSTTDSYSVGKKQIEDIRGNALNLSEQQLLQSLPGVDMTQGCVAGNTGLGVPGTSAPGLGSNTGSVGCALVIRGSRMNAVNWEFEGIPTSSATNNENMNGYTLPGLGLSSVQLTPGVSNASFGNAGSGTVNMLAQRGTYPGFADIMANVGGPSFQHNLSVDYGTASQDGRWSNYASVTAQNYAPRWGPDNPGDLLAFGGPSIFRYALNLKTSREGMDNFVYRLGKSKSKSLQIFLDSGFASSSFAYGGNPNNSYCFLSCTWTAPSLTLGTTQSLTGLLPGQNDINERIAYANLPISSNTYRWSNRKFEYDDNINPSTYLAVRFFNATSSEISPSPTSGTENDTGGRTVGTSLDLTKTLSAHHLVTAGSSYDVQVPIFSQDSPQTGLSWAKDSGCSGYSDNCPSYSLLADFIPSTAVTCPKGTPSSSTMLCCPQGWKCGYLSQYFPNGIPKPPAAGFIERNLRKDLSFYLTDSWTPNERLKVDYGVRMDAANYTFPQPGVDPVTCLPNFLPATWDTSQFNPNAPIGGANCPTATFTNITHQETNPHVWEPRVALAYTMGSNDALRLSYGRSVRFVRDVQMDAFQDPSRFGAFSKVPATTGTQEVCGGLSFQVPCVNYAEELFWAYENDYGVYPPGGYSTYKPETINNYEASWSHQFTKGLLSGIGFRITPWARRGYDAESIIYKPLLDSNGNPVYYTGTTTPITMNTTDSSSIEVANGLEVYLTKLKEYGLSVIYSANFTNARTNVPSFGNNQRVNSGYFTNSAYRTLPPGLYPEVYVSPFTSTTVLSYRTHSGWRFSTQTYYNVGYPMGLGTEFPLVVDGQRVVLPWTNTQTSGNGAEQYVSPGNPGSFFNPNIAATRGFSDNSFGTGLRTHPNSVTNITIEREFNSRMTAGFTVNNIFDIYKTGAGLDNRWQPVATGIGGPESGTYVGAYATPNNPVPAYYNVPGGVFYDPPTGIGRNWYFYLQTRL